MIGGFDLVNIKTPLNNARGVVDPYLRKLTALAFLAPDIQRAILEGWQFTDLRLKDLPSGTSPLDWYNQHKLLGLAQAGPATLQQSSCKMPAKVLQRTCQRPAPICVIDLFIAEQSAVICSFCGIYPMARAESQGS